MSQERKVIQDTLAEKLLDRGLVSKKDFEIYIKFLKEIFSDLESVEDMSDEEVFGLIHDVRMEHLKEKNLKILRNEVRDRFFKESIFSRKKNHFKRS